MSFSRKEISEFYFSVLEDKGQKTVYICKCKTKRKLAKKSSFYNLKSHIVSQHDYSKDMSLIRPNKQQTLDFGSISNKAILMISWLDWVISGELEFFLLINQQLSLILIYKP